MIYCTFVLNSYGISPFERLVWNEHWVKGDIMIADTQMIAGAQKF